MRSRLVRTPFLAAAWFLPWLAACAASSLRVGVPAAADTPLATVAGTSGAALFPFADGGCELRVLSVDGSECAGEYLMAPGAHRFEVRIVHMLMTGEGVVDLQVAEAKPYTVVARWNKPSRRFEVALLDAATQRNVAEASVPPSASAGPGAVGEGIVWTVLLNAVLR